MVAQLDILPETAFKPVKGYVKGIPVTKLIELYQKGVSQSDMARMIGCSIENINQRLKPYRNDLDGLQSYKNVRADILAFHQHRILNQLSNEDIKKASGYQKVGMFSLLYDKERLERGETTQNIGYADYTKTLQAVMAKRQQLEVELGLSEGDEG